MHELAFKVLKQSTTHPLLMHFDRHSKNTRAVNIFISVLHICTSTVAYSSLLDDLDLTFTERLKASQAVLGEFGG